MPTLFRNVSSGISAVCFTRELEALVSKRNFCLFEGALETLNLKQMLGQISDC